MALAALTLLNAKMGRFCVKACRMEIINLRFAPMGLKELTAVAITGLLVKNHPFILFLISIIFSSITTQLQIRPSCLKVFNSYVTMYMRKCFASHELILCSLVPNFKCVSFSENWLYKTLPLNFQISMKCIKFTLLFLFLKT